MPDNPRCSQNAAVANQTKFEMTMQPASSAVSRSGRAVPSIRAAPAIILSQYFEPAQQKFKSAAIKAGLGAEDLSSHQNFIPLSSFARLLAEMQRSGGRLALIRSAEALSGSYGGLVGHLALSAPTVRSYLRCLAGFAPLFVTSVDVGFAEDAAGSGCFYWHTPVLDDAPVELVALFSASVIVGRARNVSPAGWTPMSVTFESDAPEDVAGLTALFGRRLSFRAERTAICFDSQTLERAMPAANAELFSIYSEYATRLLKEVATEVDLVDRVSMSIVEQLRLAPVTLDSTAHHVRLSPRSLQRRLELAGTSFERVLDDVRRAQAERLLCDTDMPLAAISLEVGYRSQSTFTRAVQRWFSETPRAFRMSRRRR